MIKQMIANNPGWLGDVMNVGFGVNDYVQSRKEGDSVVTSAGKAAASFAWGEFYYGGLNIVTGFVPNALKNVGGKILAEQSIKAVGETTAKSVLGSIGGHALSGAGKLLGALQLPATIALSLTPAAIQLAGANLEHTSKIHSQRFTNKGNLGSGYFNMNEYGYTMRQRSINAIQSNRLNTQSVLGNEARTYSRSNGI